MVLGWKNPAGHRGVTRGGHQSDVLRLDAFAGSRSQFRRRTKRL